LDIRSTPQPCVIEFDGRQLPLYTPAVEPGAGAGSLRLTDVSASYEANGFVLCRNAIGESTIDAFERRIMSLVTDITGQSFETLHDPRFASFLQANRETERRLYEEVRTYDWIMDLARSRHVTACVSQLLGSHLGLMRKVVLRIDLPQVVRELAVWHQDYRYVRGNQRVVTAWIPLQDTSYIHGCLMIMPGSHRLGALEHDGQALTKRHYPSGIFDREVRYVEMRRGDLLLFHSLLLHSSGINLSDRVRLSLQSRYTCLHDETDASMGPVIPIHTDALQ
jgi:ectoine hydroxylase-related dioxygenase (phytanoyl-CoA dioxygenase family)